MAGTRSSARQTAKADSSPSSAKGANGTKRKADDSSSSPQTKSKRGRPSKAAKAQQQKTIEETMPDNDVDDDYSAESSNQDEPATDDAMEVDDGGDDEYERPEGCWFWLDNVTYDTPDARSTEKGTANGHTRVKAGDSFKGKTKDGEPKDDPEKALKDSRGGSGVNALDKVQADETDVGTTSKVDSKGRGASRDADGDAESAEAAVEEDSKREQAMPSNILEKGIIYFFTRGRVGVDDPDSVQDIARSYFVLRPLPAGAKLTDGVIQDSNNIRLCALPKKVWPKSGRDRFMVFVDQARVSMATLKENFFAGSEYSTKTTGTRHTPEVTPLGEGVYAMTSTGGGQGTTHLAYMLTIPSSAGEVQKDMGLAERGSFVISLKNPESSGPANAQLPEGPGYPKEFIEEFRGRGWMPAHPKHLDYANAQMLLIGEDFDSSSNLDAAPKDEKDGAKETPQEELEKLEGEDEQRVENLKGDDTVFADLGISSKDYPKVMTTW